MYTVRQLWVAINQALDLQEDVKMSLDNAEVIGYYCNPEWYFDRKKKEEAVVKSTEYDKKLQALMAGKVGSDLQFD